jgi:hypothetical protein
LKNEVSMKINLTQLIAFSFSFGWVIGEILNMDRRGCIEMAIYAGIMAAFFNNAHGILWNKIKELVK